MGCNVEVTLDYSENNILTKQGVDSRLSWHIIFRKNGRIFHLFNKTINKKAIKQGRPLFPYQ
jgi:hypothetical protein